MHFTVMVFGENAEQQLAPFQENNCNDCPAEFLQYRYKDEWYGSKEEAQELHKDDFDEDEGYWENPNRQWDWYLLGGRWCGYFLAKEPSDKNKIGDPSWLNSDKAHSPLECDSLVKSNLDVQGLLDQYVAEKAKIYDTCMGILEKQGLKTWKPWDDFIKTMSWEDAKIDYWEQPAVKAIEEHYGIISRTAIDALLVGREEYCKPPAITDVIKPHAVIYKGEWIEVADNSKLFAQIWASVPDSELVSIYDCHM